MSHRMTTAAFARRAAAAAVGLALAAPLSAQVLEDLAAEGHDLPRRIVDWRQLSKLKSTYTDALPSFIHPQSG